MSKISLRAAVQILRDMSYGYSKKESEELVEKFPVANMTSQERETIREFSGKALSVARGKAARSILRAYRKDLGVVLNDKKLTDLMQQASKTYEHVDIGHLPNSTQKAVSEAVERLHHYSMENDPGFNGFEIDFITPVYFYDTKTDEHRTVGYTIVADGVNSDETMAYTAIVGITIDGRTLLDKIDYKVL